jgi:hypothetical protein
MACIHSLATSIFVLLAGISLGSATTLEASLIRRHSQEKIVAMSPKAEIAHVAVSSPSGDGDDVGDEEFLYDLQQRDALYCNRDFPIASDSSPNACTKGYSIGDPTRCREAALRLGFKYNGTADNTWTNPLSMPKNCSVKNGVVHYNPTQPEPASYDGRQICLRLKYADGTSSGTSVSCPEDFEAVGNDFNECYAASKCVVGLNGCRMPEFKENSTVSVPNRPQGCFREPSSTGPSGSRHGCFNFNSMPPTATVEGNPVCKLTASAIGAQQSDLTAVSR